MYKFNYCFLSIIVLICCTGCFRQAYYLSPFHVNSNSYHAMPLKSDSIAAATYAGAGLTLGGANDQWTDNLYSFQGHLHRSHNFGEWQGYYGAAFGVGNYTVNPYHDFWTDNIDTTMINSRAGTKFFGGYGLDAGINYCHTFPNGEWRIIGLETVYRREFGEYLRFRKDLPSDAANIIYKNASYFTAGITTDIIFKTGGGNIGFKSAIGSTFNRLTGHLDNSYRRYVIPTYFTQTLHFQLDRFTGYGMLNFGTFAANLQLGMNYRL